MAEAGELTALNRHIRCIETYTAIDTVAANNALNRHIRCIETEQEALAHKAHFLEQTHKMYWNNNLLEYYKTNKPLEQTHKMYWNYIYTHTRLDTNDLNRHIRCIETKQSLQPHFYLTPWTDT